MMRYLADTNHLTAAVRLDSSLRARFKESRLQGNRLGTCLPVLCEVEAGIPLVHRPQQYRIALDQLLHSFAQ